MTRRASREILIALGSVPPDVRVGLSLLINRQRQMVTLSTVSLESDWITEHVGEERRAVSLSQIAVDPNWDVLPDGVLPE